MNFVMGFATFIAAASFANYINLPAFILGSIATGLVGGAVYLLSQLPQQAEDRQRGDVSVAIIHGEKKTLAVAVILITLGFILSAIALVWSSINSDYLITLIIYFSIILAIGSIWVKKRNKPISDFKTMNTLTLGISYAANIGMMTIYLCLAL